MSDDSYKQVLSVEEIKAAGVDVRGKLILNTGDFRVALRLKDGSGCGFGRSDKVAGWQNAHSHKATREVVFVHSGVAVVATLDGNGHVILQKYEAGSYFVTEPNVPHNVFTTGSAETFSIKSVVDPDNYAGKDWYPAEELDTKTKAMSEDLVLAE